MARRRIGIIREDPTELEQIAEEIRGSGDEPRLEMLMRILERPNATAKEIATQISQSERTVRRWWKMYREEGMTVLIPGYIRYADGHRSGAPASSLIPAPVRAFLNGLPTTKNTIAWIEAVRTGLATLLGDVDRVTINVMVTNDQDDPQAIDLLVTQHVTSKRSRNGAHQVTAQRTDLPAGEMLLAQARRTGFPVDEYHKPHHFDYSLAGVYLGTIMLWRERQKPPISTRTIDTMRSIEPFLTFLLSDCAIRRQQSDPSLRIFQEVIDAIAHRIALTTREREVFTLQLHGKQYDEIAALLSISKKTVEKHIGRIHYKAGTRSYSELFARFFTPLRDD